MTRLKYEDIKNTIEQNSDYLLLSKEYKNSRTKLSIYHVKCKNDFQMDYDHFKRGQRCPNCVKNKKSNDEEFKNWVHENYGTEYEVLGTYKNNRTKLEMLHTVCNETWDVRPDNFKQGYGCPTCGGSKPLNTEIFKERIFNRYNGEYTVLGEYINNKTDIEVRHESKDCNFFTYPVRAGNILYNETQCPICSRQKRFSKGEDKIKRYLDSRNIKYIREFRFDDCKNKQHLPFDFKVILNNSFFLLEYDGEQHFRYTGFISEENVKKIQKRDKIKDNYCKNKGIPLLRISYKEYKEIDTILENYINSFNDYNVAQ